MIQWYEAETEPDGVILESDWLLLDIYLALTMKCDNRKDEEWMKHLCFCWLTK